jgi:hypothetical protein
LDDLPMPGERCRLAKGIHMPIRKITEKTAVALFMTPGVKLGAGGFMIVGGKIVPIPPHGPAMSALLGALNKIANAKQTK